MMEIIQNFLGFKSSGYNNIIFPSFCFYIHLKKRLFAYFQRLQSVKWINHIHSGVKAFRLKLTILKTDLLFYSVWIVVSPDFLFCWNAWCSLPCGMEVPYLAVTHAWKADSDRAGYHTKQKKDRFGTFLRWIIWCRVFFWELWQTRWSPGPRSAAVTLLLKVRQAAIDWTESVIL